MDTAAANNQTPPELNTTERRVSSPSSPVQPLAPLEYLQNQRRGSITDPSLHASPPDPAASNHHNHHANHAHHHHSPLAHHHHHAHHPSLGLSGERTKRSPRTIRPASPFVFGDASVHPPDLSNPNIRRLLRSPSNEASDPSRSPDRKDDPSRTRNSRPSASSPDRRPPHDAARPWAGPEPTRDKHADASANMDVDHRDDPLESKHRQAPAHHLTGPASGATQSPDFDFNMRRHSIAEHPLPHRSVSHSDMPALPSRSPRLASLPHGLKRKISQDRVLYPMGEEEDVQEGAHPPPTIMPDVQGPAPKRRGSAFDTHRIAQLSLYDRRESVDSRAPSGQAQQWWGMQDRRDSTSSMFSNTSIGSAGGYSSSGFSGESAFPARQGLANMAWPPPHPSGPGTNHEADAPMSGLPRHLQARAAGPGDGSVSSFPPVPTAMPPDRRMSVPDVSTAGHAPHGLRSKSRPSAPPVPSRSSERQGSTNPSEGDGIAEESETSPTQGQHLHPPASMKEGASPYSRSPELRVSHKLAERKRRKEMKDLFDELRDQLPADRGMKASKWEILTKAVDYISTLKATQQDMSRELEMLRLELDSIRSNGQYQQGATPNHTGSYASGGGPVGSPYTHPPGLPQHPPDDPTSTT